MLDGYNCPEKIVNLFKISIKVAMRFEQIKTKPHRVWEEHSQHYIDWRDAKMATHLCDDKELESFDDCCTQFGLGCALDGNNLPYIALITHKSILKEREIVQIVRKGIPIVLSHRESLGASIEIDWNKTKVEDMKTTTFRYINRYKEIHFIHDTYDEALKLKELELVEPDNYLGE